MDKKVKRFEIFGCVIRLKNERGERWMEVVMGPDSIREEKLCRLMAQYKTDLLHMSYVYLRDAALAEDAVQETFVKAYHGMASFRGDSSEKTWLMRIAINTCKDMRRAAWFRYVDRSITLDNLPESVQPYRIEDDTLIIEIMKLPRKLMEVVLLYYYQGMSVNEAADSLGIAVSTVSTRLKHAREKLRSSLEGGRIYG